MKWPRRLAGPLAMGAGMGTLACSSAVNSTAAMSRPATIAAAGADTTAESAAAASGTADSAGQAMVPAGFGSLRQDDLSLHIDADGVLIRAIPLDESIIRLLTPDSYRAMRDLQASCRKAIATVARRHGGHSLSVWLVSFYGVAPDARFTPSDLSVTSGGQAFQPYEVLPLTANFGEQRLRQRETQSALYLFDGDIELDQPVAVTYQRMSDASWEDRLQTIERERALVRARASKSQPTNQSQPSG